MTPLSLKKTLIKQVSQKKENINKKFTIRVLSTYLSDLLGEWSNVTTLDNIKIEEIPLRLFENLHHVLYIKELNLVFILKDQKEELKVEETKEDVKTLIHLLNAEGFKAVVHPNPRRDILIETQSGKIVISKFKKRKEYLVNYYGNENESFELYGSLHTHQDVLDALKKEFYITIAKR